MNVRAFVGYISVCIVFGFILVVILGSMFGQPLLVSFVDSGSMEPTIKSGDGFFVIPEEVTGSIERGDVIVYQAERLHGGGLVTHRVVGVSDRGFITKGDANIFLDQDGNEPPVKRVQVVGVALQFDGQIITIPHLSSIIGAIARAVYSLQVGLANVFGIRSLLGMQGLAYLFFGATLLWYAVGLWRQKNQKSQQLVCIRETGQSIQLLLLAFITILVVATTIGMVGPAGPEKYEVVSAHYDSQGTRIIPMGTTETTTHQMGNSGIVPVKIFLEPASTGIDVSPREVQVDGRSSVNATVTLTAPPKTGYYQYYLIEHRYFAILPDPLLHMLYEHHPWTPVVFIDMMIAIMLYGIGVTLGETNRIKLRSRSIPITVRIRRWLRALY